MMLPVETMVTAFRERCRASGLAVTHQREIIYRAIISSEHHPSPEVIFDEVRRQIPSISLATVYKNIHTFLEAGLLREVSPHHGSLRLEANLAEHHHLVCTRCKAIDPDDCAAVSLCYLQIPGQTLSKSQTAPMEPLFERVLGEIKHLGGFSRRQPFHIPQQNRRPVDFR